MQDNVLLDMKYFTKFIRTSLNMPKVRECSNVLLIESVIIFDLQKFLA